MVENGCHENDGVRHPVARRAAFVVLVNVFAVLFILAAVEISLILLLNHPPSFTPVLRVLSSYYTDHDRRIIQALPQCAIYDSELAYVLRAGACSFENYDFHTVVSVNSMGLRDDEQSLVAPRIIALGDSFTMGWGVSDQNSFPSLVERSCGLKVLNAGISSYGTVRELKMLERVDTSGVETLLLQYSDNDFDENRLYYERGNRLIVMTRSQFSQVQDQHREQLKYYPGRHLVHFVPFVADRVGKRIRKGVGSHTVQARKERSRLDARYFLNALNTIGDLSPEWRIIAFRINGRDKNSTGFSTQVRAALEDGTYSEPIRSLELLEFSQKLTRDNFFVLDDHLSKKGHRLVTGEILRTLRCKDIEKLTVGRIDV